MHLYIHIPFCKQACHYCDFHFSTNQSRRTEMVEAIATELVLQKNYLPSPQLTTVYLGGGTPSLLNEAELGHLFAVLHRHYQIDPEAEITLEANPDNLSVEKLQLLRRLD